MAEVFGTRTRRDVWHRALENTPFGQLSLAMYEANYVMEDAVEVSVGWGSKKGGGERELRLRIEG